ncbi:MAG TPA: DHHA1 domain-containing protein [Agromyces sp.]|nr:DHHA1 domain-containing protein [Agromyces sp.]
MAKAMAAALGGGGGGKPDLAQGGGSDLAAIPAALTAARSAIGR